MKLSTREIKSHFLDDHEEFVGRLINFKSCDESIILHFSVDYIITIGKEESLKKLLDKLRGKEIGVFRLDNKYYIKESKEEQFNEDGKI